MEYRVNGILQARILEWVAFPFSRGSSLPWDQTQVSRIAGEFFTSWATREAPKEVRPGQKKTVPDRLDWDQTKILNRTLVIFSVISAYSSFGYFS